MLSILNPSLASVSRLSENEKARWGRWFRNRAETEPSPTMKEALERLAAACLGVEEQPAAA